MDLQAIVDSFSTMACVISVEKKPGGNTRVFRIVTGNKPYIDSINHPIPSMRITGSMVCSISDKTGSFLDLWINSDGEVPI